MRVLAVNGGSSSEKLALYDLNQQRTLQQALEPLWSASAEWSVGEGQKLAAQITVSVSDGKEKQCQMQADSRGELIAAMLDGLWSGETKAVVGPQDVAAVGHRVVHGGAEYTSSVTITPQVKDAIYKLAEFAPQHNPANLEGITACERIFPNTPEVAVFDTAFHATLPQPATVYPGPYSWYERGIRRYGFHGISHQYCAMRAAQLLGRDPADLRLVTCHLGGGCSLAAIAGGRSVDTTMGFTPLDGLMMGSRSGSVDPGILIYLLRQDHATADQLDETLNRESGLKGVSGVSSDIRPILKARDAGDERARLALDVYIHRLRQGIGAMLAALDGADALVFTGGVGEHTPLVRAGACATLGFAGVTLDADRNAQFAGDAIGDGDIATSDARMRVLVIHTQEDWMIARETLHVIGSIA